MCEDPNSNPQQHDNLCVQSPLYIETAKKLERKPTLLKITGFDCDPNVNFERANSGIGKENSEQTEIQSECLGSGGQLRALLAEYGDFRINCQWDPLRSRESPPSEAVTESSSSEYTASSCTPRNWGQGQGQFCEPEPAPQTKRQGQGLGGEFIPQKQRQGLELVDEDLVGGECTDRANLVGVVVNKRVKFLNEDEEGNKEQNEKQYFGGFECDDDCTSSIVGEEVETEEEEEQRTRPIPIPEIDRLPSFVLNDFESKGLLKAMMDSYVKVPTQQQTNEEHRVVLQYNTKEALRITEADLSMALMKIQELQFQRDYVTIFFCSCSYGYLYVIHQNEVLKKQLDETESGYNNVQQVQADAYQTQIMHMQEELNYYRENCDGLEELVTCQQDQILKLNQQVAQLTDSQNILKVKLSKKEDINLAMHNRTDELAYELDMTKQMMEMQRQELLEELEIEIDNSATAQEHHLAEMEYMSQKQQQLEEQNKILCQQIAALQKQQEQSILVAPLVRNVVNFVMAGMVQFATGFTVVTKESLRLFFHFP